MSLCYGIAWIFLFEMSHHTASSDAGERAIFLFLHPPSMKSWVLLNSATTPYQSALLVTQDILGRNSTPSVFQ